QPLTDPVHGKRETVDGGTGNGVKIGGLLASGNDLIVNAWDYYDAAGTQSISHFRVSADLSQTGVVGPLKVMNQLGLAGYVFKYMMPIPAAWQASLGGPALTGGSNTPIIGRTSLGPSVTVFN